MSDDIKELVKRLRHRAVLVNYGNGNVGDVPDTDCNNAADALEALTEERDRLKAALEAKDE